MPASNIIKCRHCNWVTRKWGHKSNPGKAFARLRAHLNDAHPDEADKLEASLMEMCENLEDLPEHEEYLDDEMEA